MAITRGSPPPRGAGGGCRTHSRCIYSEQFGVLYILNVKLLKRLVQRLVASSDMMSAETSSQKRDSDPRPLPCTPFWEYTLTGFGEFLEQRGVAFTEPFPSSRVCSMCGRVPSCSELLPCGHVSCQRCRGELFEAMKCPFDSRTFAEGELVRLRFELPDLEKRRVLCVVGGRQCTSFEGDLSELLLHLPLCRGVRVRCDKCYGSVERESTTPEDHCRHCCERNAPSNVTVAQLRRVLREIGDIQEELDTLREQGGHYDSDLEHCVSGLVDRLNGVRLSLFERSEVVGTVE
ncbi:hypothetical protein MRX96_058936 [Rhipicephalus microplus]